MRNAHVQTILAKLMSYLPPSDDVTYHRQYIQVSTSFMIREGNVFSCVCVVLCRGVGQGGRYPMKEIYNMMQCNMAQALSSKRTSHEAGPNLPLEEPAMMEALPTLLTLELV